jgi:hypothetical protein
VEVRSAAHALWRFKMTSLTIIVLTLAGCAYVTFGVTEFYRSTTSYLLINPASASVDKQKQANPFLRYDDPSVLITTVGIRLDGAQARAELLSKGAAPGYEVAPSERSAAINSIADIKVEAPSRAAAVRTAEVVGAAFVEELQAVQAAQAVRPRYMITSVPVGQPAVPTAPSNLKLWLLVAIVGAGSYVLLVVVYGLSIRDRRRLAKQRLAHRRRPFDAQQFLASGPATQPAGPDPSPALFSPALSSPAVSSPAPSSPAPSSPAPDSPDPQTIFVGPDDPATAMPRRAMVARRPGRARLKPLPGPPETARPGLSQPAPGPGPGPGPESTPRPGPGPGPAPEPGPGPGPESAPGPGPAPESAPGRGPELAPGPAPESAPGSAPGRAPAKPVPAKLAPLSPRTAKTVETPGPNGSDRAPTGLVISEALRFKHYARVPAVPVTKPDDAPAPAPEPEVQPETDPEVQSVPVPEVESAEPEAGSEVVSAAESGVQSGADPEVQSAAEPNVESEADLEATSAPDSEIESATGPDITSGPEPDVESGADLEITSGPEPKSGPEVRPPTEADEPAGEDSDRKTAAVKAHAAGGDQD